jgi:hypothetical protein
VSDQVSHPYKTTSKVIFMYILIFIFSKAQYYSMRTNLFLKTRNIICKHIEVNRHSKLGLYIWPSADQNQKLRLTATCLSKHLKYLLFTLYVGNATS